MVELFNSFIGCLSNETNLLVGSQLVKDSVSSKFIVDALRYPKSLRLLYRASENNFSAKEFHRFCDGKPHTLTIIKTKGNQLIAGYTPLTWEMSLFKKPFSDATE